MHTWAMLRCSRIPLKLVPAVQERSLLLPAVGEPVVVVVEALPQRLEFPREVGLESMKPRAK